MDSEVEKRHLIEMSRGNTSSFDVLFLYYYPRILGFIDSLVKNKDESKDISQEIFLKLWNYRERLLEVDSLKAYLFQMAKNGVYDYFKQQLAKSADIDIHEFASLGTDTVEDVVEARDLELLIDIVIEGMPAQRKNVFILSRKKGLSNEEIAIKLNISKRTVETHITNALHDIRKLITRINIIFL